MRFRCAARAAESSVHSIPRFNGRRPAHASPDIRRPVRRAGLRHAAVPAVGRSDRHARHDEFRQSGALRLRHARRLRDRGPDAVFRLAVPRHPAGGVHRRGGRQRGVRTRALPPSLPRQRSRPVPAHDRHRLHVGRGCGLLFRHYAAAARSAGLSARLVRFHGPEHRQLPAVPGGDRPRHHRGAGGDAGIHAFRGRGPRSGRQPAHGARPRHQCRRRVCADLCAWQRACRPRRRARHRDRRTRSLVRLHLSRVRADRGVGS